MIFPGRRKSALWISFGLLGLLLGLGGLVFHFSEKARKNRFPPPGSGPGARDIDAESDPVFRSIEEINAINRLSGPPSASGHNPSVQNTLKDIQRINEMNRQLNKDTPPKPSVSKKK
jgi:hypothetical protein